MVECMICNGEFDVISPTHLKSHGLKMKKYRELYPNAPLMSEGRIQRMRERRQTKETKEKLSRKLTGKKKKWSEEGKERIRQFNRLRCGKNSPTYGKPCPYRYSNPEYKRKLDGEVIRLRSSWELAVAEYLDGIDINWEYELIRYELGGRFTYCPDFFILDESNNVVNIIEVKGWLSKKAMDKIDLFRLLYPQLPYELWTKDVLLSKGIHVVG